MAIRFNRYIDITSGVGVPAVVPERDFITRIFTTNPLIPVNTVIKYAKQDLPDIGAYFGFSSVEYLRAAFYFSFVSKNISSPQYVSFARWADVDTAPYILGAHVTSLVSAFQSVTSGGFGLTINGVTNQITAMDFSGDASYAAIATRIQAKIRTNTGTMWTAATVTFDNTLGAFNFTGGDEVVATISVSAPLSGTDISQMLAWLPLEAGTYPVYSAGILAQTPSAVLSVSTLGDNDFGSFVFIPTLTTDEITDAATWNSEQNVYYQYLVPVTASNRTAVSTAIVALGGAGMTLAPLSTEYPEMFPGMILASTRYDLPDSTQNYAYQQVPGLTPSVSSDTEANACDALRVNYYGVTQTAGQQIAFYQEGYLTGAINGSSPIAMNVYANEQWLKDALGAALMTLLLGVGRLPANRQGRAQALTVLQGVAVRALNNGTISVGALLSDVQKQYITEVSGNTKAWYQVQNSGYWLDAVIESYVDTGVVKYKLVYTLVYKKDDAINRIEGFDILI